MPCQAGALQSRCQVELHLCMAFSLTWPFQPHPLAEGGRHLPDFRSLADSKVTESTHTSFAAREACAFPISVPQIVCETTPVSNLPKSINLSTFCTSLYFSSLTPKITVKLGQIQTTAPNPLFWAEQNTKVSTSMCYASLKGTIIILLLFHFPTYYYYSTTHLFHTRLNNPSTAISSCTQPRITHPTSFKQVGSGPGRGVVVGRAHTGETALT